MAQEARPKGFYHWARHDIVDLKAAVIYLAYYRSQRNDCICCLAGAFAQKKAALERRTLRRVRRGPRQMSAIGWIPLKSIMDGR